MWRRSAFAKDAACPLAKLAIVYDGKVLFAGAVLVPSFDTGPQTRAARWQVADSCYA